MSDARFYNTHIRYLKALSVLTFDGLFVSYWCGWILIRLSRYSDHPIPFLNNWLTDFVYLPIVIHIILVLGHAFIKPSEATSIPSYCVLMLCGFVAFVFEYLMPSITSFYIFDPWDVAMYFAGGLFYYFFHQPHVLKRLNIFLLRHWS